MNNAETIKSTGRHAAGCHARRATMSALADRGALLRYRLMRMIDGYGEATVELAILSSSERADVRSVDLGVRGFYGINILAEC